MIESLCRRTILEGIQTLENEEGHRRQAFEILKWFYLDDRRVGEIKDLLRIDRDGDYYKIRDYGLEMLAVTWSDQLASLTIPENARVSLGGLPQPLEEAKIPEQTGEPIKDTQVQREPPPWVGRPATIGDSFVGRESELMAIADAFTSHKVVVISGGAGCGKSRLAAEYTHRSEAPGFWTAAGRNIAQTLAALAPDLGIETRDRTEEQLAGEIRRHLSNLPSNTLWVVDNVGDLDMVNALLSIVDSVRLLITSRDSRRYVIPRTISFLPIDVLEPELAIKLLCSRSDSDPEDPALREIVDFVGRLPLALEMLAVRLGQHPQNPRKLLAELRRASTPFELAMFQTTAGATLSRPHGVFATITSTLNDLPEDVRQQISALGYIADAPVPLILLGILTGLNHEGVTRLLDECGRRSIVSATNSDVKIHALTVTAIASTNEKDALPTTLGRACNWLEIIDQGYYLELRLEICHHERILYHSRNSLVADQVSVAKFAEVLSLGYYILGRYEDAVNASREAQVGLEQVLSRAPWETLNARDHLASIYAMAGFYQEATQLRQETLALRERALGPDDPDTLRNRCDLAEDYSSMGRYQDAMQLYVETLETQEKVLGPDHPDTLHSRMGLADHYCNIGRVETGIELCENVLVVQERDLGQEHIDTLFTRDTLAVYYSLAGRYEEAVQLGEATLSALEEALGPTHPLTLTSRCHMSFYYYMVDDHEKLIQFNAETVTAFEKVVGPDHPEVLAARRDLADAYRKATDLERAIELYEETLATQKRVLGSKHPHTLETCYSLALAYHRMGRYEEAIQLFEQTLESLAEVLGPDHRETLQTRFELAQVYSGVGRLEEAMQLHKDILAAREQLFGPDHPDTLLSLATIALNHSIAGFYDEAIKTSEEALKRQKEVLGLDHPLTIRTQRILEVVRLRLAMNSRRDIQDEDCV